MKLTWIIPRMKLSIAGALALAFMLLPVWSQGTPPKGAPPKQAPKKPAPTKSTVKPPVPRDFQIASGPASSGGVALTFDDGPSPKLTPQLLAILKERGVKATFFLLGSLVDAHPELARMIHEEGFEVGNHTYSHPRLPKLSRQKIREQIVKTQEAIERATGQRPKLFRAPYGAINTDVMEIVEELGLTAVFWSVDVRDWSEQRTTEMIRGGVVQESKPGAIILLHDIHKKTIAAVPGILDGLKEKNLATLTAGEMVALAKAARKSLPEPSVDPPDTPQIRPVEEGKGPVKQGG